MKITLLLDNKNSWMVPYARDLETALTEKGHFVTWCNSAADIPPGDCAFLLSCEKLVPDEALKHSTHNLVIHASALPKGKGWSPLTWQILEGKNDIPVTLFEAEKKVDNGPIYDTRVVHFEGHELLDEMREQIGRTINDMALRFVEQYPPKHATPQEGEETFYPRRKTEDSEIDPEKSMTEIFNGLRVADNERYPAFFHHKGKTYILKIYKKEQQQ